MAISKRKITLMAISLFALVGVSQIVSESYVDAAQVAAAQAAFVAREVTRPPADPTQLSQPRRDATPPPQQPGSFAPQSGGFMRTFGTAMLGGFLGSMLFRDLANAGFGGVGGFGSSGIGLIDILLFAGVRIFSLPQICLSRWPQWVTARCNTENTRDDSPEYTPVQEAPAINNDIDYAPSR